MVFGTVLVVYVSLENAAAPELEPFKAVASEFLGNGSEVRVVTSSELSDREAIAQAPGADGIVELSFSPDRSTVRLRCYAVQDGAWVERRIGFSPVDNPVERGRFLGLVVASTLGKTPGVRPIAERSSQPARRPRREAPARVPTAADLQFGATMQRDLDLGFWEAGALAMLRLPMLTTFSLQLGLSGSVGQFTPAGVTSRAVDLGGGVVWDALPAGDRVRVAARLDGWLGFGDLSRPLREDSVEHRPLWRAAGDALGEVSYRFGDRLGVYGAAGIAVLFSRPIIYVRDREVAASQPVRLKAELGVMTSF